MKASRMKVVAAAISLGLALTDVCCARIGETRDEIVKRYGTPKP